MKKKKLNLSTNKWLIMIIFSIIILLHEKNCIANCIKLKSVSQLTNTVSNTSNNSNKLEEKLTEDGSDPERIPGVRIHTQVTDADPANTKRYDPERLETLDRIKEIEIKLVSEKSRLETIVAAQVAKINEISQIAMTTYGILDSVSSKAYNDPKFYFNNQ